MSDAETTAREIIAETQALVLRGIAESLDDVAHVHDVAAQLAREERDVAETPEALLSAAVAEATAAGARATAQATAVMLREVADSLLAHGGIEVAP